MRVYRFRTYLKGWNDPFRLPDVLHSFASRQQAYSNALCTELEKRCGDWAKAHPPTAHIHGSGCAPGCAKTLDYARRDKTFWDSFRAWAMEQFSLFGLNWESGADVLEKFQRTLNRMKAGGGPPRPKLRLDSFSILHRYTSRYIPKDHPSTGGGTFFGKLFDSRSKAFTMERPGSLAFASNSRDSRRDRCILAAFGFDGHIIPLRLVLHRQLDDEAIVKNVRLVGYKENALGWVFHICFIVEEPKPVRSQGRTRAIGVDIGWRILGSDLRVAVAYDGHAHKSGNLELRLPLSFPTRDLGVVGVQQLEDIQAMRDRLVEQCKAKVLTVLPVKPERWHLVRHSGLLRMLFDREQNVPESAR